MKQKNHEHGFSTVELLVTLFVVVAFLVIFYQMFVFINKLSTDGYQKAIASNMAYENLRMYATTDSPTWFTCDSSTDLKTYPAGTGQVLLSGAVATTQLPKPITQSLIATAPYGCATTGHAC